MRERAVPRGSSGAEGTSTGSLVRMGKMLGVLTMALIVITLFAVLGESLPDDSALRGLSDSIRGVGRGIGKSFGGGYGMLPGSGG